ncbi:4-amino-4-deoxy-L-arabinose-phosphoundecaprenol flippase subunit ArnF [Dickeya zeae]|uniref:4-amino-4-deoxy-L-arabinose-phosphoundecaprenol flippase subunit ArnF n=1 Tax=Dickeya zeae TaxID=204042 RepID=UPI0003A32968|nr:4-amino-4-deoxy-L-arabinose-phosphoundecaprenol flippase subunit ArnF [Dickeya zeae]AUQ27418.1 4-amino-4-deoxy-L-arabinose-phospho-UDP flippase [Dickeya zeae]MCA6986962.1 4-amino-4-deoxy-L-arabinose-phospho-UDP flippase [Dickeya zeae]UJR60472.1 4-amino-4-deoxy-L-arabinose-phospho-UDP flippase [Dickeya zeae]
MKGYGWALLSVLLVSAAQLSMKWGMSQLPSLTEPLPFMFAMMVLPIAAAAVLLGLAAYAFSMLSWFNALRFLPLSRAYPLLSLSYVLVWGLAVAMPIFPDTFSTGKLMAIALIIVGVWLVCSRQASRLDDES